MNYSEETLKEAEMYAQVLGVQDLSDVLLLPRSAVDVAIADPSDELGKAIKRGRLRARAELRLGILALASQGSNPAQLQAERFIQQLES